MNLTLYSSKKEESIGPIVHYLIPPYSCFISVSSLSHYFSYSVYPFFQLNIPSSCLSLHPFLINIFMLVGDWGFKLGDWKFMLQKLGFISKIEGAHKLSPV
jgi:hypothetical protein